MDAFRVQGVGGGDLYYSEKGGLVSGDVVGVRSVEGKVHVKTGDSRS